MAHGARLDTGIRTQNAIPCLSPSAIGASSTSLLHSECLGASHLDGVSFEVSILQTRLPLPEGGSLFWGASYGSRAIMRPLTQIICPVEPYTTPYRYDTMSSICTGPYSALYIHRPHHALQGVLELDNEPKQCLYYAVLVVARLALSICILYALAYPVLHPGCLFCSPIYRPPRGHHWKRPRLGVGTVTSLEQDITSSMSGRVILPL